MKSKGRGDYQPKAWLVSICITTEFGWGTDVDARLVDVLNKLQQVEELPEEAGESDVQVASVCDPMMWLCEA